MTTDYRGRDGRLKNLTWQKLLWKFSETVQENIRDVGAFFPTFQGLKIYSIDAFMGIFCKFAEQRRIKESVKYLWWSFFCENRSEFYWLKIFAKILHHRCDRVLNIPLIPLRRLSTVMVRTSLINIWQVAFLFVRQ